MFGENFRHFRNMHLQGILWRQPTFPDASDLKEIRVEKLMETGNFWVVQIEPLPFFNFQNFMEFLAKIWERSRKVLKSSFVWGFEVEPPKIENLQQSDSKNQFLHLQFWIVQRKSAHFSFFELYGFFAKRAPIILENMDMCICRRIGGRSPPKLNNVFKILLENPMAICNYFKNFINSQRPLSFNTLILIEEIGKSAGLMKIFNNCKKIKINRRNFCPFGLKPREIEFVEKILKFTNKSLHAKLSFFPIFQDFCHFIQLWKITPFSTTIFLFLAGTISLPYQGTCMRRTNLNLLNLIIQYRRFKLVQVSQLN